jgi:peptidoglycan/LPS O-acetylase OafA/YrhL
MRLAQPSIVRGNSIGYRPELDGIRGLAIIMIVFHHFDYVGMHYFGGRGFLGVDIFFVLSGFLITQILLTYKEKGVKLRTFYIRRVARLYPILLISVLILLAIYGNTFEFLDKAPAIRSLLYIKNFWPWGGIFGPMWSLSAEEQFYLIFPLILFVGIKIFKSKLSVLLSVWLVVIWYLGYTASGTSHNFNSDGVFNLVVFRPSIILVGSLIAINKSKLEKIVSRFTFLWLAIFAGLVALTIKTQFPPLAGMATGLLILLFSDSATAKSFIARALRRLIGLKPLAWIGLLSYSIYIWHLPMIYISSQHFMIHALLVPKWEFFLKLLVTAILSFYLVERPFLKLVSRTRKG